MRPHLRQTSLAIWPVDSVLQAEIASARCLPILQRVFDMTPFSNKVARGDTESQLRLEYSLERGRMSSVSLSVRGGPCDPILPNIRSRKRSIRAISLGFCEQKLRFMTGG